MLKIKFTNFKKIMDYINQLKQTPLGYASVFSSLKKMVLFFILYLFITGLTAIIIIFSFNKKQEIVLVPKVINMEFYNAYKILHSYDFNVEIELKSFNNINSGLVAFQSLQEGKKVKKGRKIKLIISSGAVSADHDETSDDATLNSYIIKFKLPESYSEGRVKILFSDNKYSDKVIFNELVYPTNKIMIPIKIYGNGIQKIYINDELYIEKDIE
ncbi:MAG: PASTA domain-containing protein [bacterium]|nr:PASTA domain-containing protein [bacterium]